MNTIPATRIFPLFFGPKSPNTWAVTEFVVLYPDGKAVAYSRDNDSPADLTFTSVESIDASVEQGSWEVIPEPARYAALPGAPTYYKHRTRFAGDIVVIRRTGSEYTAFKVTDNVVSLVDRTETLFRNTLPETIQKWIDNGYWIEVSSSEAADMIAIAAGGVPMPYVDPNPTGEGFPTPIEAALVTEREYIIGMTNADSFGPIVYRITCDPVIPGDLIEQANYVREVATGKVLKDLRLLRPTSGSDAPHVFDAPADDIKPGILLVKAVYSIVHEPDPVVEAELPKLYIRGDREPFEDSTLFIQKNASGAVLAVNRRFAYEGSSTIYNKPNAIADAVAEGWLVEVPYDHFDGFHALLVGGRPEARAAHRAKYDRI